MTSVELSEWLELYRIEHEEREAAAVDGARDGAMALEMTRPLGR